MTEPWSWSARLRSWSLPNMDSTREKTRSEAAELGVIAKTMRATLAQVGMVGWLIFHHLSSAVVYSLTSVLSKPECLSMSTCVRELAERGGDIQILGARPGNTC